MHQDINRYQGEHECNYEYTFCQILQNPGKIFVQNFKQTGQDRGE